MTVKWSAVAMAQVSRARTALRTLPRRVAAWYSPSHLLLSLVAALALLLFATAFVGSHYYGKDIATSLTYISEDGYCDLSAGEGIGVHCFGDYRVVADYASEPNPWDFINGNYFNYPAGSMLPHTMFQSLGDLFKSPRLGLITYLIALIAAMSMPAIWASKGRPLATRVGVFALFGGASVPAMMAFDRGNSVGFAVPAMLVFLIAMRREQYRTVVIAIVIASLIKPQYILLVAALLAHRRWRHVVYAMGAAAGANALAFLMWPRDFPGTIIQSVTNTLRYGGNFPLHIDFPPNVSLAEGAYLVFQGVGRLVGNPSGGQWIFDNAATVGATLALAIAIGIVALGSRLPPVIGGALLLMTASLVPTITWPYYLVFALPIAAVLLRDPASAPAEHGWRGVLDMDVLSRPQKLAAFSLVIATAGTVSRVLLPFPIEAQAPNATAVLASSGNVVPILWLAATVLTAFAWARAAPAKVRPVSLETHLK